jgi:hypothetical protein
VEPLSRGAYRAEAHRRLVGVWDRCNGRHHRSTRRWRAHRGGGRARRRGGRQQHRHLHRATMGGIPLWIFRFWQSKVIWWRSRDNKQEGGSLPRSRTRRRRSSPPPAYPPAEGKKGRCHRCCAVPRVGEKGSVGMARTRRGRRSSSRSRTGRRCLPPRPRLCWAAGQEQKMK